MRLLKREVSRWLTTTSTFSLVDRGVQNIPYAILSHRWGPDEVTFKDIENGNVKAKPGGYRKLDFCAAQAARDGLLHSWIDTCCINKDSSAELSTAINSMYKWYRNAMKCYVYLSDVRAGPGWETAFSRSEWYRRGWTLQEVSLLQQSSSSQSKALSSAARCHLRNKFIRHRRYLLRHSEERERFSWTARRETTIEEEAAYCLLGIFDVQTALVYGEGQQKALARLQREIRLQADPRLHTFKDATWIVPFERNPLFTGREAELTKLEGRLFTTDHASRLAITGLGGVGKTQLVLEVSHRTRVKHPACSIICITATTIESLQQDYLHVAHPLFEICLSPVGHAFSGEHMGLHSEIKDPCPRGFSGE